MEEVKFVLETAKEGMDNAIHHLEKAFIKIRAGKANPSMLSTVMVDYYGSQTPLSQVSNINTPDARTISVQPWEKSLLSEIETAIMHANLGFNPMNNGEMIIINVPPLTEERRIQLVKQAKAEANKEIKNLDISEDREKNAEIDIQEMTDDYTKKIDALLDLKEAEIMKV